jgi:hypothetical protein
MAEKFATENNGTIFLNAIVESWNNCQLVVYTENSLGEHTTFHGIRSVCSNVIINENSLNFENCNNADYPPIIFTSYYDPKSESHQLVLIDRIKRILVQVSDRRFA